MADSLLWGHLQLSSTGREPPACPYLVTLLQDVLLEKIDRYTIRQ